MWEKRYFYGTLIFRELVQLETCLNSLKRVDTDCWSPMVRLREINKKIKIELIIVMECKITMNGIHNK